MATQTTSTLEDKLAGAREILHSLRSVVVAFSAGVDSSFLLALALETLGRDKVLAAMGISASLAERERQAGRELADRLGAERVEVETCEMACGDYTANPPDRCLYCKRALFERLAALAEERGLLFVVAGANADDRGDFRPGLRAGREFGVRNPLLEAGLTKDEIRKASRAMGLPTWDKPAMACLASRVPYGQEITAEKLARIERAEYVLKDMGFSQCRVRDHDRMARIEVPREQIARAAGLAGELAAALKALGYLYVALDLEGFRSGSMNEAIAPEQKGQGTWAESTTTSRKPSETPPSSGSES